jgi:hypothetical protein
MLGSAPPFTQSVDDAVRVRYECTRLKPVTRPVCHANRFELPAGWAGVTYDRKYTRSGRNTQPLPVRSMSMVPNVLEMVLPSPTVASVPTCVVSSMEHSGVWPRWM